MVTGSHIPDDRNGLKFYRRQGEIDKADEARILAWHAKLSLAVAPDEPITPRRHDALAAYQARYREFFGVNALRGLTVGVYQHSSVGRDVICDLVAALGATPVPLGRADRFIPVDTEALRPEDVALAADWGRQPEARRDRLDRWRCRSPAGRQRVGPLPARRSCRRADGGLS